jgi:zinc protease
MPNAISEAISEAIPKAILLKRLANGLTVHLKEIHTAPIISHWLWYRVGSRNEVAGKTGLSHWVEHMQFKGTPAFPGGVLDRAIAREGGSWNAFTHFDWTAYYETMPAEKIDLALRLEADRMVNCLYDPAEVEAERTVILAEREGNENEPLFRLGEAVQNACYPHHPYRTEVIGLSADLRTLTREDLYGHYRRYYHPANAILSIAGDFEIPAMLARIEALYAAIPAGETAPPNIAPDPPLEAEKRLEVPGPGTTGYLQISYRAPAAADPDFLAYSVLDSLLTGPSSLNMFGGGGVSNKTSRLYRLLVENELAVSVSGGLQATLDPFTYDTVMTVHPKSSAEAILEKYDAEIRRLQEGAVSEAEVARAIKQARALFAYGSDNITNQAFWLGYAEIFDRYDWFTSYLERLARASVEDVRRAACLYLQPQRRVVGVYLPNGEETGADEEEAE